MFVMLGSVIKHKERDFSQLVVRRCRFGFLSMRVRFLQLDGKAALHEAVDPASAFRVDSIEDFSQW